MTKTLDIVNSQATVWDQTEVTPFEMHRNTSIGLRQNDQNSSSLFKLQKHSELQRGNSTATTLKTAPTPKPPAKLEQ